MNALAQFSSGLVEGAYSLLSRAAAYVYPQPEEQVPLFDGSTVPQSVITRVGAMLEKLESEDTEHMLKRSLNPRYEIPEPVVLRLKASGIMDEVTGELDPQAVKVAESIDLAVFHVFGRGATGRGAAVCANYYASEELSARSEGRSDEAKAWMERRVIAEKEAQAKDIRSYAELAAYNEQKNE